LEEEELVAQHVQDALEEDADDESDVLPFACEHGLIVLTSDVTDFGDLHRRSRWCRPAVRLSLTGSQAAEIATAVLALLAAVAIGITYVTAMAPHYRAIRRIL